MKTKTYIDASKSDWITPSKHTFRSFMDQVWRELLPLGQQVISSFAEARTFAEDGNGIGKCLRNINVGIAVVLPPGEDHNQSCENEEKQCDLLHMISELRIIFLTWGLGYHKGSNIAPPIRSE